MFSLWLPCPDHPEARMELRHLELNQQPIMYQGDQLFNAELVVEAGCTICGRTYRYRIPVNFERR